MSTDALKIAKLNARREREREVIELAKVALGNPVVEILVGTTIVELLYKGGFYNEGQREIGGKAIIGAVVVQQLAPTLPSLFMAGNQLLQTGLKALPAIAGASAGLGGVL